MLTVRMSEKEWDSIKHMRDMFKGEILDCENLTETQKSVFLLRQLVNRIEFEKINKEYWNERV